MTAPLAATPQSLTPRRIARLRALAALVWAAALVIAVGDDAGADVPLTVAALVTIYPLVDVVASLSDATVGGDRARLLQINAAISALAAAALAAAAFGADEGAVLAVFGAWALVSGAIQLANANHRRRELPLIASGAISALAGISFIASSQADDPNLTSLAGYAALGALFFLVWAHRTSA